MASNSSPYLVITLSTILVGLNRLSFQQHLPSHSAPIQLVIALFQRLLCVCEMQSALFSV